MLYTDDDSGSGYATSLMYSPILQRHIAIARVRPDMAASGTRVNLEVTINHRYSWSGAHVARLPLFNPPRKTTRPGAEDPHANAHASTTPSSSGPATTA